MAPHPEEVDNLPETLSEEALRELKREKWYDELSLLVSPESKVESTSKSKSHEAADVTLTTASLTFLGDEVSHLEESVAEKDFGTIAVPGNFSDELSEMSREEVVLSSLGGRALNSKLANMPKSLDRINKTLSTVTECQSKLYNQTVDFQIKSERHQEKHYNQTVDGQIKSERNQEHMMILLENLRLEKVEAEVARRLAEKEKTKTNNRVSKATTARPSMRSSSISTKCGIAADNYKPFRDTTNIGLPRPMKKLTKPKGPVAYRKWEEKKAAGARKEDIRQSQAPGRKLPWE